MQIAARALRLAAFGSRSLLPRPRSYESSQRSAIAPFVRHAMARSPMLVRQSIRFRALFQSIHQPSETTCHDATVDTLLASTGGTSSRAYRIRRAADTRRCSLVGKGDFPAPAGLAPRAAFGRIPRRRVHFAPEADAAEGEQLLL
jgi:hypothetical protein